MPRALAASDAEYPGSHDELHVTEPLRVMVADDSADFREGISSFLEKRKPVWSGK